MAQIIDIDETEKISNTLLELVNSYPGLDDQKIEFVTLPKDTGIGFFPGTTVLIQNNRDIVGTTFQLCAYAFEIIYRLAPRSEKQKIRAKEFLDGLGRWLERQPVILNGVSYTLESYPDIHSGNRRVRNIARDSAAHLQTAYQDGAEDWSLSLTMTYENYF